MKCDELVKGADSTLPEVDADVTTANAATAAAAAQESKSKNKKRKKGGRKGPLGEMAGLPEISDESKGVDGDAL